MGSLIAGDLPAVGGDLQANQSKKTEKRLDKLCGGAYTLKGQGGAVDGRRF
jgi:hypothetical protein